MLAMALRSFGVQLEPGTTGFPAGSGGKRGVKPKGTGGVPIRLRAPRIEPVSEAVWSQEERELLLPVKQQRGYILNVYATLARHPAMYRPWLGFARYILRESSLRAREREMLICRIAWLTGGEYEWSAHIRLGKEPGLTDDEIAPLAKGPDARGWPASDAVLVRAVDELHYDALISDATWTTLAKRFDTHQMMDLAFTVGAYKLLAMALNSFGTQLDKDMPGFPKRR
jgi:4-carboxymuconolactone decarboxylase